MFIPERYKNAELNDKTECIRLLKDLKIGQGALLCGKYGCGKTFALYAYGKEFNGPIIRRKTELRQKLSEGIKLTPEEYDEYEYNLNEKRIIFIGANEMYRETKNFDTQSENIYDYKGTGLLLIDDLGAEYAADSGYFQSI